MLDKLLYYLNNEGIIHLRSDHIKFIGFGYGSNIALYFCKFNYFYY